MEPSDRDIPLCVDCDGTLVHTDLLHESAFHMVRSAPWRLLWLPWWWMGGKPVLKQRLAETAVFDWGGLPLNEDVMQRVRAARDQGRRVVLATASHRSLAEGLARHLGVFDEVLATDTGVNLSAQRKREELVARYGERGYDYIGNSRADLPVWSSARRATVVSGNEGLAEKARAVTEVEQILPPPAASMLTYLKALRLHQWLKNLLIFVPLLAAHAWEDVGLVMQAVMAFFAFSLCASAVYVLNDLLDLESDRQHVRKRRRPFASGRIPIWHGVVLIPVLLVAAFALAWQLPLYFLAVLLGYAAATLAYSVVLKRQVIVDVLLLAGLYTTRVIAGGAATAIVPSFWLLAFSMFLFLSLAMVKRYSELLVTLQQNKSAAAGRGYHVQDLPVLMSTGTSAGMIAVLIFALYIDNPDISRFYDQPMWLWPIPPLLLYWISRMWMKTHRGEIDDDPVVFAIRDWQSLAVGAVSATLFFLA